MKRAKVYINLSTHNGVPYNTLLAMMCGCSILSNNNEITENLLKEDFSIVTKQLSEFAPALSKILDGGWKDKGEQARKFAIENYDYDSSVKLWKAKLDSKSKEVFVQ